MVYSGSSSLHLIYAFIIQMLSSVNISSVWLYTERCIYLHNVQGYVMEKHKVFTSVCLRWVGYLLQQRGGIRQAATAQSQWLCCAQNSPGD